MCGSCNTLNDLYNRVCVPKKIESLNLHDFNMITEINELKTLTKHISCECNAICGKILRIKYDKVNGFVRVYDGTRYLVLFGPEKYDTFTKELDLL